MTIIPFSWPNNIFRQPKPIRTIKDSPLLDPIMKEFCLFFNSCLKTKKATHFLWFFSKVRGFWREKFYRQVFSSELSKLSLNFVFRLNSHVRISESVWHIFLILSKLCLYCCWNISFLGTNETTFDVGIFSTNKKWYQ